MTYETPEFHWNVLDGFMHQSRYAVAAPVGSAKTTIVTKLGNIWSAFCEPVEELLIVTSTGKLAGMWLEQMGHALETNSRLREDFGDFKGVHWGSEHLELVFPDRRCFIRGIGRGEATRGRRPDRITIDDPEDEASLKSQGQRDEFRDWFRTALINRLDGDAKHLTYIGTVIRDEALVCELINHPWAGWAAEAYAMWDEETGESLWPAKFPVEFIQRRREEIGEDAFQQEFQNNPVRTRMRQPFDLTKIKRGSRSLGTGDRVTACFDPSFRAGGDPWAYTVVQWDDQGDWWLREERKEASGLEELGRALLDVRRRYKRLDAVGIETAGQQVSMEYFVKEIERRHRVSFPVVWLKHTGRDLSKEGRIMMLVRLVQAGHLMIAEGLEQTLQEMALWRPGHRGGAHAPEDHLIDSLQMHMEVIGPKVPVFPVEMTHAERVRQRFKSITRWRERVKAPSSTSVPAWYS